MQGTPLTASALDKLFLSHLSLCSKFSNDNFIAYGHHSIIIPCTWLNNNNLISLDHPLYNLIHLVFLILSSTTIYVQNHAWQTAFLAFLLAFRYFVLPWFHSLQNLRFLLTPLSTLYYNQIFLNLAGPFIHSQVLSVAQSSYQNIPTAFYRCIPAVDYMFKVNTRNTRARCEICSKFTIKIPQRRHWRCFSVFFVNFEQISHLFLVFLLLTLSR